MTVLIMGFTGFWKRWVLAFLLSSPLDCLPASSTTRLTPSRKKGQCCGPCPLSKSMEAGQRTQAQAKQASEDLRTVISARWAKTPKGLGFPGESSLGWFPLPPALLSLAFWGQ